MPVAIEPSELLERVEEAKRVFDPEIHGRHDLPAMPRYPIDSWYDSKERGPEMHELLRGDGHLAEPAMMLASMSESLMTSLNPGERVPYLEALRYMAGENPDGSGRLNDFWDPDEVGSIFIWFAYNPDTCDRAAKAIENARFVDLLQTAHERKFATWGSDGKALSQQDFWRVVRGDLEHGYGIHSIHKLEQSFIRYFKFCSDNKKAFVHEYWGA